MIRTRTGVAAVVAGIVGLGALAHAQVPGAGAARHVRSAPIQVGRLVGSPITNAVGSFLPLRATSRGAEIFGVVQNHMGTPVPRAGTVILRELRTGRVSGTTEVNDMAQFSLRALPPGLYTAELFGSSGTVLASTPAFSIGAGQVLQIAQTIPVMPAQGLARVAASATSSALFSAASSGVLAVAPGASVTPAR